MFLELSGIVWDRCTPGTLQSGRLTPIARVFRVLTIAFEDCEFRQHIERIVLRGSRFCDQVDAVMRAVPEKMRSPIEMPDQAVG